MLACSLPLQTFSSWLSFNGTLKFYVIVEKLGNALTLKFLIDGLEFYVTLFLQLLNYMCTVVICGCYTVDKGGGG